MTMRSVAAVSGVLPVTLTSRDVEQYPEFIQLLSTLPVYITPSGLSQHVQKDLTQAEEVLRHEKHGWLLNHILYHELQELLLDYQLKAQDVSLSSGDQQFHTILQECLTLEEIGDYLDFSPNPGSSATLLGLTREDINRQNPYKKHLPALQQKLIPEMEERLRQKCETLVNFQEPHSSSDSNKLMFAKASHLPALVEEDKHRLVTERTLVKQDRLKKDKQFWMYYQTLLDSLGLLEKLISKYRLQIQPEHDTITTEWLLARCDAMCLKIRLLEVQILCDTYTVETQKALRIIRKQLDEAMKMAKKEKVNKEQALQAYESVGMGFDAIVEEYGRLKQEVENKQWALSELQQSSEQTDR